ncbi:MAG: O-antigen ligase family protein [Pseudomonadota bacterium]
MDQETHLPARNLQLVALIAFALLVTFCGGTSNPNVLQDVILRPLCALILVAALYGWRSGEAYTGRAVFVFLAAWAGWTFIQLVPLPQWAWQSLPGRTPIAELDTALGLEGVWRPISWVPTRGWNALAGMIVPFTALALAVILRGRSAVLLSLILGVALIDALMNFLQLASQGQDTFYFYKPHPGKTDGVFSNENHSGVFSALGLLITTRLLLMPKPKPQGWQNIAYGAAYLILFLSVLVGGSRAALVAGLGALLSTGVVLFLSLRNHRAPGAVARASAAGPQGSAQASLATDDRLRWLFLIAGGLLFVGLASLFFWLERSASFDGILSRNTFEDLRWELAPVLLEMIQQNWLFGIGFGAFEEYYHIYEPTQLLLPLYINQAHNDWGQLILEGGLPAVAIALGLAGWIGRKLLVLIKRGEASFPIVVFWLSVLAILAAASLIDYPIRTPIFQFAIVWLLLVLEDDERSPALQARRFAANAADGRSDSRRSRGQRGGAGKTRGFEGGFKGEFKRR